ncbi:hypothetical protein Hanom_Chr09g00792121 [Helianthus anomalus]
MGVRPLREGEKLWYEQIHVNFKYPTVDAFAAPPTATEGARYLNPRPCRAITPAREEVIMHSSEDSIGSSEQRLNLSPYANAGSLRELGVDSDG